MVSLSIDEFLSLNTEELRGRLTDKFSYAHSSLSSSQSGAWNKEFEDLKKAVIGRSGRIIFEYSIPGMQKTIDVVLLTDNKIYVIEYKVNSESYNDQDIRQTNGYALRLKYFHSRSNDNLIVPILVATEANDRPAHFGWSKDDMVLKTVLCNSDNLSSTIDAVNTQFPTPPDDLSWVDQWEKGVYKASPSIIEAIRNIWREKNVEAFKNSEANVSTRLQAEDYIKKVVEKAKAEKKKIICFVTGVPGAGKTLVGLNLSVSLQGEGASMLSGNGPLVKVITETIKADIKKYKISDDKDECSAENILRDAYGYKKEIFEKRLDYRDGEVYLKEDAELLSQHVIIFDEAQRAWTQEKMIRPGQTQRKYWQEKEFPFSEPAIMLWDMDQLDWGVFVCLVGGGQEINTGEAGISEWFEALQNRFKDWEIHMSAKMMERPEYNSTSGKTVEEYCQKFKEENRIQFDDSLYLTACQRSIRSEKVAQLIQDILDCNQDEAREIYSEIGSKYPIYLTRNVEDAKRKLRERKLELGKVNEDVRIGMLMSSKAARLRPLGYEIRKVSDFLDKIGHWFLDGDDYVVSSNFLEIAVNEFFVQGLELDVCAVIWDADFRYNPETNDWDYYNFNGLTWSKVDNDSQTQVIKRFYMKNAYRVLLTRARAGLIIVLPEGSNDDKTRSPQFYDPTYEYLKGIGLTPL